MAQVSTNDVVQIFKKVYGNINDLQPEDYKLQKMLPFAQKQRVGDNYVEAMVLTAETGWTLGGSGMDAFDLNPAVAGTVKQSTVTPSTVILPSVVPWGVLSRSAGGGTQSFIDGTKFIVKNNLKSHGKLNEILRIYGQAPDLLGYVSWATATYRGVSFTQGTGTLNGIAFTNGVNTTTKNILLAPGQFATGIWVGNEGCPILQVNSSGAIVAQGNLVSVAADYGYITVNFTPVAASSLTSHRLCFVGQDQAKDLVGVKKILTTSGTVFGIDNSAYSLWKGNYISLGAVQFTFARMQSGIAAAVNRGGLEGDTEVFVNPRTWGTLITNEAAKRVIDSSYKTSEVDEGQEAIVFWSQAGKTTIHAHRMVKEGDAFALHIPDWSRSGSAEISFTVPGIDKEIIFPLENQAGMAFRSFSDQYIFCHAPARSIYWDGINDESAT